MLILLEGLSLCFILLIVCVIGTANGAVGCVYFYEPEVQKRAVALGLTTEVKIKRDFAVAGAALWIPCLFFIPAMVYFVNGARGFGETFRQMTAIFMIAGLFDRFFIDWYWVGKTQTWLIPGTEDLMPYIPKKVLIKKWMGTMVGFPILAAILSALMTLF